MIREPRFRERILLAAALHDLGKCCPGFQAVVHGKSDSFGLRHEVFSVAATKWIVADPVDRVRIDAAILTHHRSWNKIYLGYYSENPTAAITAELQSDWLFHAHELLRHVIWPAVESAAGALPLEWSEALAQPWAAKEAWAAIQEAIENCHEFVGTTEQSTARLLEGRFLRGALMIADHSASARKLLLGLTVDDLRAALDGPSFVPRDKRYRHQNLASQHVGHAVLVAPTGSGKTEAALLWYLQQRERLPHTANLFYSLPFQASMNAMKIRIEKTLGNDHEGLVALHHSRSLQALYAQAMEKGYGPAEAQKVTRNAANLA